MARIPPESPVTQVLCAEIRVKLLGPPNTFAKLALANDRGDTFGQTFWQPWSPRSLDLLRELATSIEEDYIDGMMRSVGPPQHAPDDGESAESNAFYEPEDDGLDFTS